MAELSEHYAIDAEQHRLVRTPHGRLEFLRTQELLRRVLPPSASVLDVGGGTGVHAEWIARDGHAVRLVDVVPDHVAAAARLPGVTAAVGDARELAVEDGSFDVVLLLGPLYHLVEAADRARALAQAQRVLRVGGVLAAAGISRYLSVIELGGNGGLGEGVLPSVAEVIASGRYDGHAGFTTTHWHTAQELGAEVRAAAFSDVTVYGIEGPAWPALDAAGATEFSAALRCARLVETDPLMINSSAHLLAVATR